MQFVSLFGKKGKKIILLFEEFAQRVGRVNIIKGHIHGIAFNILACWHTYTKTHTRTEW